MATCSIQDLITSANANLFTSVGEATQRALLLELLCDLSSGGGGGAAAWGTITGVLADQLDLQAALDGKLNLSGGALTGDVTNTATGFFQTAVGTTAQQPGVPTVGMTRYNSTTGRFEVFEGAAWRNFVRLDGDIMTGQLQVINATANQSAYNVANSLTGAVSTITASILGQWATTGAPILLDLRANPDSGPASANAYFIRARMASTTIPFFAVRKDGQTESVNFAVGSTGAFGWGTAALSATMLTHDISLFRDAASTLAQRVGTAAQTFRLYRTFTDAGNYERLALQTAAGQVIVAAETAGTGGDNIDLVLTPAGTGQVTLLGGAQLVKTTAAMTSGAAAAAGTLTNAPSAGNPAVWCPITFNGVQHWFPCWT